MAANNSGATLNGIFRVVYSKEVRDLIPDFSILQQRIPFSQAEMLGLYFSLPVVVSDEHGFTYGGNSAAAYSLNNAISMQTQDAQIPGAEVTLQSGISYGAVSRASQRGETCVEQSVRLLIERMKASSHKRIEISMLYGQSGIGTNLSQTGSSTSRTYTLSTASWASGIWSGMENANLDCYNGASKLNTNAAVVIAGVDAGLRQLSVTGNASDLTAIDAATTSAVWYFYGAYGNEMVGINKILTNTGTLFNISASQYNLWAANTFDCGSAEFSMGKILSGLAKAVGRGLLQDTTVLLNPDSFANIMSDLAAQRKFDGSYSKKKAENGSEAVVFYGQNGMIELLPHPMVKAGEAFALPLDVIQRVGSTDISFQGQGPTGQEEYLFQNQSSNAWTTRCYTDQAILIQQPAYCVKFTSIVNS